MRSPADDCSTTIAPITRRSFLRRAGLALASFSISAASEFFDWLTRIISTDRDLRFAGQPTTIDHHQRGEPHA